MTAAQQLRDLGYCVVPGILDPAMLADLRRVEAALLTRLDAGHRQQYQYQGSNVCLDFQDPVLLRLYAWPPALAVLAELGFPAAKWSSGFLISKPPGGKPLYWHQDWAAWDHPVSASGEAPQIFLMYYLVDTTRENGCLRVIPRTHRQRIDLHDRLPAAHEGGANQAEDGPMFADHEAAVDVCVRAGDVVVGDSRLLHAAHANRSAASRTVLTLWYYSYFDTMSEDLRARFGRDPASVPAGIANRVALYAGSAEPTAWNRVPGSRLGSEG